MFLGNSNVKMEFPGTLGFVFREESAQCFPVLTQFIYTFFVNLRRTSIRNLAPQLSSVYPQTASSCDGFSVYSYLSHFSPLYDTITHS